VVWEPSALRLMQEMEAEKDRISNTDIKTALKVKKLRPRQIIPQ
jgi:hypothetical protein